MSTQFLTQNFERLGSLTASASDIRNGKTFIGNKGDILTGTWIPRLTKIGNSPTDNGNGEIKRRSCTVSGYNEYYLFHAKPCMGVDGSVSWTVSQGSVTRLSLYGGFNYWLLTGCNTDSVTINGFYNHDCGGYSWHFSVWACK